MCWMTMLECIRSMKRAKDNQSGGKLMLMTAPCNLTPVLYVPNLFMNRFNTIPIPWILLLRRRSARSARACKVRIVCLE